VSPIWACLLRRGVEALHLLDDLAELRVRDARDRFDNGRLLHLVGNHLPHTLLAEITGWRFGSGGLSFLAHGKLFGGGCRSLGFLREKRLETSDLTAQRPNLTRLFELSALLLDPKVEKSASFSSRRRAPSSSGVNSRISLVFINN
jgi:hypothetical protein